MKKRWKSAICLLAFLVFTILVVPVSCEAKSTTLDIGKGNITISKSGNYVITGTTDTYVIQVKKGVSANITLKDVKITSEKKIPFTIQKGAAVNIILTGENTISTEKYAAIYVVYGGKFIISAKSTGTLAAVGGYDGAGIGGYEEKPAGSILIKGGTVNAYGGIFAPGIGSVESYTSKMSAISNNITISGGVVTAVGGVESATGIGGPNGTVKGNIIITGGTVLSYSDGIGIGGGSIFESSENNCGYTIKISGGKVTAYGNKGCYAIGGTKGTTVAISGGMIYALGDYAGNLLESQYEDFVAAFKTEPQDIHAEKIVITGGDVQATTFSVSPVNTEGKVVLQQYFNCKKGNITGITFGGASYGCKDMVSEGFISIFLPEKAKGNVVVSAKNGTLFSKRNYSVYDMSRVPYDEMPQEFTADLSKGDLELLEDGFIYQNKVYKYTKWKHTDITVTGKTDTSRIVARGGEHSLFFDAITANVTENGQRGFLSLTNSASVRIILNGQSTIAAKQGNAGVTLSKGAKLMIAGETKTSGLTFLTETGGSAVIATDGFIEIHGGTITCKADQDSYGFYLGNRGSFSMYGGICDLTECTNAGIFGNQYFTVNMYGGDLTAGTVGYFQSTDPELPNDSVFRIIGGTVTIKEWLTFGSYEIYGGDMKVHILGNVDASSEHYGCLSKVLQVDGNVTMDVYMDEMNEDEGKMWEYKDKQILGGTFTVTGKVTEKEV